MEMDLEGMQENMYANCSTDFKHPREECMCRELKIICKESNEKRAELGIKIQKTRSENEALERKLKLMEMEKLSLEEELKVLRDKNWKSGQQKTGKVIDLAEESEEEDEIVQILIENNVLECEKKKAEADVKVWKERFKELESRFLNFDETTTNVKNQQQSLDMEGGILACYSPGTPSNDTLLMHRVGLEREKRNDQLDSNVHYGRRVRRQLNFKEEEITPSTPGIAQPTFLGSIDSSESENELCSGKNSSGSAGDGETVNVVENSEERISDVGDGDAVDQSLTFILTPKRKRAANIVKSETESDDQDDDDILISKFKKLHICDTSPDQVSCSELNCCRSSSVEKI